LAQRGLPNRYAFCQPVSQALYNKIKFTGELKLKTFIIPSTHPKRARQAWQILIGAAMNRQSLTYEGLSVLMYEKNAAGVLDKILGHVAYFCIANDLPHLTTIVVNKATGKPGLEIPVDHSDIDEEREKVYRFNWYHIQAPSPSSLEKAFKSCGEKS
jgi:hypothetical protein